MNRSSIQTGDLVKIDIATVISRSGFDKLSPYYKEFVMESEGKVFHAFDERHGLIHLDEEPKWLFWSGDLIKVEQEEADDGECEQHTGETSIQ